MKTDRETGAFNYIKNFNDVALVLLESEVSNEPIERCKTSFNLRENSNLNLKAAGKLFPVSLIHLDYAAKKL